MPSNPERDPGVDEPARPGESVARALLAQVDGMGPRRVQDLLEACGGSAVALFERPGRLDELDVPGVGQKRSQTLKDCLRRWDLERARRRLDASDVVVLSRVDEAYPAILDEIYDPPPALYFRGDPTVLDRLYVAVVGTRSCTSGGAEIAERLARGLSQFGIGVVSGLAAGIDAAAHRGALATDGDTVAVLGTGVDRVYPSRNRELQSRIRETGVLLSEYPPGTGPKREHFPERNRLISGLSRAVVVVQARARSGALITADSALEQGRDVYAVPGDVDAEHHDGCHMLIKQGAGLVEDVEDVIDYLQLEGEYVPPEEQVELTPREHELFEQLDNQPVHLDQVVESSGFSLGTCARVLVELESKNLVLGLPGQRYRRSRDVKHLTISVRAEPS